MLTCCLQRKDSAPPVGRTEAPRTEAPRTEAPREEPPREGAPPWAGTGLMPYPSPFVVPPGGRLSTLASEEGVKGLEGMGPELVLLARGFAPGEPLRGIWVPLSIVEYGACSCCVGEAPRAAFLDGVVFDQPGAPGLRDPQIFCAPPLGGEDVRLLGRMVLREERLPQLTLSALISLEAVGGWTPLRAAAELAPLFARLEGEAAEWKASLEQTAVAPPQADWGVYGAPTGPVEGPESARTAEAFAGALQQRIQAFARRNRVFSYRQLPPPDAGLYSACREIMDLAAAHGEPAVAARLLEILTHHPLTLVCVAKDVSLAAPGQGERPPLVTQLLGALYREEVASVGRAPLRGPEEYAAPGAAPYVFRLGEAAGLVRRMGCPTTLHSPRVARAHLNTFLGGYLDALDLASPAPSYITGSAAMSSVLRPAAWEVFPDHRTFLESYYPVQCTEALAPNALARYLEPISGVRRSRQLLGVRAVDPPPPPLPPLVDPGEPDALRELTGKEVSFVALPPTLAGMAPVTVAYTVGPGADVDIAVDAAGDPDVFDATARAHFVAIRSRFPDARLERVEREGRSHMWRVEGSADKAFRVVEIYQAGWGHICTHHVAPVRLAYTALAQDGDGFLLTATCVLAAAVRATPDYYYFASRKTVPQQIILKYARRGYPPLPLPAAFLGGKDVHPFPGALAWAILAWAGADAQWGGWGPLDSGRTCRDHFERTWEGVQTHLPALAAYGPYNLAAYPTEAYLSRAFELDWVQGRLQGRPRLRSARLLDCWDCPLEAADAPALARGLAELGLATGDLVHLDPRALGCPAWLRPYNVVMVLHGETDSEQRLHTALAGPPEHGSVAGGARLYHPPEEGAPGYLAGGEFWMYPLRAPPLAEHLRGRVIYGPLYDPAFRSVAVTWGLVAPGWAGPDEAAQRSYRAKKLWGQLSSS